MTTAANPASTAVHRTLRRLAQLPDLATEVWLTWGAPNPTGRTDRAQHRVITGSPAPTDLTALDLLRRGRHVPTRHRQGADAFEAWEDDQDQTRSDRCLDQLADQAHRIARRINAEDDFANADDTWLGICAWLTNTFDRWQDTDQLDPTFALINRVHGWLSQAARVRPHLHLHCTLCGDTLTGLDLDGKPTHLERSVAAECPTCGRVHTYDAQLDQLGRVTDLPLAVLAADLATDPDKLRKWAERGLIKPSGRTQTGRKLYNLDAVQTVLDRLDLHGARKCDACGKRFAPATARARHCSPACRKRAHRATRRHADTPDVPPSSHAVT